VTLFLCGDVMTGRGIDQVLPHPGRPDLHEPYVRSAVGYVRLAEEKNGPIPKPVAFDYPWGDALGELAARAPAARIVNLETAVTATDDAWPGKGIHYRMHPANVPCLTAARLDCCVLANNHVLDWGHDGLLETLATLHAAGIATAGAGRDADEARAPAALPLPTGGRALVFAFALPSSGVPADWAAAPRRPGVHLLDEGSPPLADVARLIEAARRPGDIVVASLHWGGNWGYDIPGARRRLAHALIDEAGVDVIHGHSSHHPQGIEIYRDRLILYGCGDFINDYEGIGGYETYRPNLSLMILPTLRASDGRLTRAKLVPLQMRRMRLERASCPDTEWLAERLTAVSRTFGTIIAPAPDGTLGVHWNQG
jgi:poly-gamma-glutamate synthesis protein (capsule biosynthesis protein)